MAPTPVFSIPARQFPAGEFISPSFVVPAGVAKVGVAIAVSAPDISDPTKSLTFELDRSDPNDSSNWLFDFGFTWQGNSVGRSGQPVSPSATADVGPLGGQTCRVKLTLPSPLTAAIAVSSS